MSVHVLDNEPIVPGGGNQPVIPVSNLQQPEELVVLKDVQPISSPSGGSGSGVWERISNYLRPIEVTNKVIIGNTNSFVGSELLRVAGNIYTDNITVGTRYYLNGSTEYISQSLGELYFTSSTAGTHSLSELAASFVTAQDILNWNEAYSWGDWSTQGFITTETDPIFTTSVAYGIDSTDIINWDTAYTDSHTHTNKTLLDTLISSGDGTNFLADDGTYHLLSTTVAGADTQVQFNDGGAFAGSAAFTFNKTSGTLSTTNISTGIVYLEGTATYLSDITGDLTFTDANAGSITLSDLVTGATNYWSTTTGGIYYGTGIDKVGINTSSLTEALTVDGNIAATNFNSSYFKYLNSNLLLGPNAGDNETGDNLLYIANSDTATPLVKGDFLNQMIEFNADTYINSVKRLCFGSSEVYIRRDGTTDDMLFSDPNTNSGDPVKLSDFVRDASLYALKTDFTQYSAVTSITNANKTTWNKASVLITTGSGDSYLSNDGTYKVVTGSGSTTTLYLHDETSDISGYEKLLASPANASEDIETVAVTVGTSPILLDDYATDPGYPGITTIPAGLWIFKTWLSVDSVVGTTTVTIRVYKRTSGGTETELFNVVTDEINSLTPLQYLRETVQPSYTIDATDRIVIKYYTSTTTASTINVSLYYEGTSHYSFIITPISFASTIINDSTFKWDTGSSYYRPYTTKTEAGGVLSAGKFYLGTDTSTATNRLNYDGYLYATSLKADGTSTASISGTNTTGHGVYGISNSGYGLYGISTSGDAIVGISQNGYAARFLHNQGGVNVTNAVLKLEKTEAGSFNATENVLELLDNPTTSGAISGALVSGTIAATERLRFNPRVADGAMAVAHFFDTHNDLNTTGSKILSVRNQGTEIVNIDKQGLEIIGKLTVSGLIDPTGLQLTPVATNPGTSNTIWANSSASNALYYGASVVGGSSGSVDYNTYYISPSGNDSTGDGSIFTPWATLGKAWTVVVSGDLVYVRGGIYAFTTITGDREIELIGKNGTSGRTIKVWNYPGEYPVFDCTSVAPQNYKAICYVEGSYLHFKGLRFTGLSQYNSGLGYGGNYGFVGRHVAYCTFENLEMDHIGGAGFQIWDTDTHDNLVLNCDSHHNSDPYSSDPYGNANGFNITPSGGNNNRFIGCRAWMNSDDGFDLYGNNGSTYFENCWAFWNGFIPEEGVPTIFSGVGDGQGFKMGTSSDNTPTVVKTFVSNCLAVHNRYIGFAQNGATHAHKIINCGAYNNATHSYHNNAGYSHIYQNNHYYNSGTLALNSASVNTYNSWNLGITIGTTDFISLNESLLLTPRSLVDNSLPNIDFMKLSSTSQLSNVGTYTGFKYYGSAPDLGPFEYYPEETITVSLDDDILDFNSNKYTPYTTKQSGISFYNGTTDPTLTTRLNLDADLRVTTLNITAGTNRAIYGGSSSNTGIYGFSGSSIGILGESGNNVAGKFKQTANISGIVSTNTVEISREFTGTGTLTGNIINIIDNPTASSILGKVLSATIGTIERISLNPRVANSGTNKAYILDTHSTLSGTTELLSIQNNTVERFRVTPTNTALSAGTSTTFATVGGVLKDFYTDVSTSGTAETDLYSYTIPANTLVNDGDKLEFKFILDVHTIPTSSYIRIYFADMSNTSINGTLGTVNQYIVVYGTILRTSSSTFRFFQSTDTNTSTNGYNVIYTVVTGKDFTIGNLFKITGQCTTNSITATMGYIEYKPAAIN